MNDFNASTGYIVLYRSLLEHPLFQQHPPEYLKIFLYCLLKASYKPRKWWDGKTEHQIPIGGFIGSINTISSVCGVSRGQAERAIGVFKVCEMIEVRPGHSNSLYVLQNFERYQFSDKSTETQTGHKQDASETPAGQQRDASETPARSNNKVTNNKGTRNKEENTCAAVPRGWKGEAFERFWQVVWMKKSRGHAEKAWKAKITSPEMAEVVIAAAAAQADGIRAEAELAGRTMVHPSTWLNGERWMDEVPQTAALTISDQVKRLGEEHPNARAFANVFWVAGVRMSPAEIKQAYLGEFGVRGFLSYSEEEQLLILAAAQERATLHNAQTMGTMLGFMKRQEWERVGPGRLIPEPRKRSSAEIGQEQAAAAFIAEMEGQE